MNSQGFDQVPTWLREMPISWNAKGVYAFIAGCLRRGYHPGSRVIAQRCGLHRRTVRRALEILVEHELLEHTPGANGHRSTYRIRARNCTGAGGQNCPTPRAHK